MATHPIYRKHTWPLWTCLFLLLLSSAGAWGQKVFKGRLINTFDSSAVAYAGVQVAETQDGRLTDDDGAFEFALADSIKELTLNISAIGFKGSVHIRPMYKGVEKIYISVAANTLDDVSVTAVSPREVVRRAVAAIKDNYQDKSYFAYSTFRAYDRINNIFRNLMEGYIVVMMRLKKTKTGIDADEGYAMGQLRNLMQFEDKYNFSEDNPAELMPENPIYHLQRSAINPNKLAAYKMTFDTTDKTDDYVINYSNDVFSAERHGIVYDGPWIFSGESTEKGRLVIDRKTYAIKRIERYAVRNPDFPYRKGRVETNVLSSGKYYFEFVEGKLVANYEPIGGKWYLKSMSYEYTNNFFKTFLGYNDYNMTTCYEWRMDSASHYVPGNLLKAFHNRLIREEYSYDKELWENFDMPYTCYSKDSVYTYLQRRGPVDEQFARQCKVDEKRYLYNK